MAVLQQIWLYEIIAGTLPIYQNTAMRVNGAWIKGFRVFMFKNIYYLAQLS